MADVVSEVRALSASAVRLREHAASFLSRLPAFRGKGRLTLLLDRWLTDSSDPASYFAVAELHGAKVALDLREFGERFIYYYRQYEPQYVNTFRSLYRGGNFLDIGSNVGIYVVSMGRAVRDAGGRIFSVEPIPSNRERQMRNVELNELSDLVEIAPVALGTEVTTVHMDGDFSQSNVNAVVARDGGTHAFSMTTLDQLAAERGWENIGALKMDVEGYEPAVLLGGQQVIARNRPIILAEFNRERMAMNGFVMGESWNLLRDLGYRGFITANGALHEVAEPANHENLFFLP